jgi:hypothetical protein
MGLIFVAAQFPVGLITSKEAAESTLNNINAHNAEIMTELQVGTISSITAFDNIFQNDLFVHPMPQPNITSDVYNSISVGNPPVIILDDLENLYTSLDPNFPFWSSSTATTNIAIGDIGNMVCPSVDASDPKVQIQLPVNFNPYNPVHQAILQRAIFDVSMERNYCWSALYRRTGPNTMVHYTFTMRCSNKNARYALQQYNSSDDIIQEALPNDITWDRKFPVPWLIDISPSGYDLSAIYGNDRFMIPSDISNIVRAGSYIVDRNNGYVYEALEITVDDNGFEWLRLRKPLEANLLGFWVYPPAVERATSSFAENQPVMQVTEKIVRF